MTESVTHSPYSAGMTATTRSARRLAKPVLFWFAAIVIAGVGVLIWTWVVLSSASGIGGEQATVVSAISLQVALLAVFFLMVTFGIAVLGFFGYRQIHDTVIAGSGDCQKFRVRGQFYERESALGRAPGIPRQVFRHERAPHTRFRGDRAGRKIGRRLRNRPPAADPGAGGLGTGWRRHLSRSNTWTDRSQNRHPDSNRKRSPNRIANSLRAACQCDGARFHFRSTPRSAR